MTVPQREGGAPLGEEETPPRVWKDRRMPALRKFPNIFSLSHQVLLRVRSAVPVRSGRGGRDDFEEFQGFPRFPDSDQGSRPSRFGFGSGGSRRDRDISRDRSENVKFCLYLLTEQ